MNLRDNENIWVLGGFLGATALVSGLVLALVFTLTRGPVEKMQQQTLRNSLQMLALPAFDNAPDREVKQFASPAGYPVYIMPVRKAKQLKAFAVRCASPKGYAGDVEIMAGFTAEGRILAVLVTSHKETPGLGSNVCERKFRKTIFNFFKPLPPGLPPNPILDQFTSLTPERNGRWLVKRDGGNFDYVTGATITSRAVLDAVEQAGKTLLAHKEEFFKP